MAKRRRSVYDRKWFVTACGVVNDGEPCWCRLIVTSDYDLESDRIDDCVIRSGEVSEKLANHIVKVHNESLKAKRKRYEQSLNIKKRSKQKSVTYPRYT